MFNRASDLVTHPGTGKTAACTNQLHTKPTLDTDVSLWSCDFGSSGLKKASFDPSQVKVTDPGDPGDPGSGSPGSPLHQKTSACPG